MNSEFELVITKRIMDIKITIKLIFSLFEPKKARDSMKVRSLICFSLSLAVLCSVLLCSRAFVISIFSSNLGSLVGEALNCRNFYFLSSTRNLVSKC